MKKLFTLLTLALLSIGTAWAGGGTEKATNTGTKDKELKGTSYTIAGTYIAGAGAGSATGMANKGVKLRTGNDGSKVVFAVNSGYTITDFKLYGVANYDLKDGASEPCISVTKVEVDGVTTSQTGTGNFPAKGSSTAGSVLLSGISATGSIAIYFDNSNAKGNQINAYYEITWTKPDATEPETTTVTPSAAAIGVGYELTLTGTLVGGDFEGEWVSDDPTVATVSSSGIVTGVKAGTANITYQWKTDQSKDAYKATAAITVVDALDKSLCDAVKTFDFTTWGATSLTVEEPTCGDIYNNANSKNNPVYPCTNTGLTDFAFQYGSGTEVFTSNKGWKIDDTGLLEGSSAGRCAAIRNIKQGQYVEFNHTSGTKFYTKSDKSDDGILKAICIAEDGHHVYYALEDGMIGFEMDRGKYVNSIVIYERKDAHANITTTKEYSTYVTTKALDFTGLDIKAYVATEATASAITVEEVTTVPAGTALILKKGTAASYYVPVIESATAPAKNLLKGSATASYNVENDGDAYVLSDGAFHPVKKGELAAGKAYILKADVPVSAPELSIVFGNLTGIQNITTAVKQSEGVIFDLQGRKVAQPAKGLYIVNGKKVIIK